MKGRLLIFLALLFSRVFVTPVCFSLHAGQVPNPAETFEQVRLKKRRSTFIEEEYFHEASFGIVSSIVSVKRILRMPSIRQWIPTLPLRNNVTSVLSDVTCKITSLFLRNRVLRI